MTFQPARLILERDDEGRLTGQGAILVDGREATIVDFTWTDEGASFRTDGGWLTAFVERLVAVFRG